MTQPYPFTQTADTQHAKASAATRLRSSRLIGSDGWRIGTSFVTVSIVAALAGAGAGGAIGGITGALVGVGIPEFEAKRYEGRVKEGGILLSVHYDDHNWTKRTKEIMQRTSAQDVSSTGEASADFQKTDKPLPRAS
jgi:hypothetical protein